MSVYSRSDNEVLKELAVRLKRRRLNMNITQQELAGRAGLNRTTIRDVEMGKPFGVLTMIQILRALDALENLDAFLPDPGISPIQLARMKGHKRQRASASRKSGEVLTGKKGEPEW